MLIKVNDVNNEPKLYNLTDKSYFDCALVIKLLLGDIFNSLFGHNESLAIK